MATAAYEDGHVTVYFTPTSDQDLPTIGPISRNTSHPNKMTQQLTHQARSAYRALLREIPRKHLASPTPLHQRLRAVFRSEDHQQRSPEPTSANSTPPTASTTFGTSTAPLSFSHPKTEEERTLRVQEAEQLAQYARAQRTYAALLERYNPGMNLDEEERIRLTARRVGLDLPELHTPEGKEGRREE